MVDASTFDLKPSFPIANVAALYAQRPEKEAAMKLQQQQQLVQGLQTFGQGVDTLVDRRNKMAQAMTIGKLYGLDPSQTQGLAPEQVTDYGKIQKASIPVNLLYSMLHPGAGSSPTAQAAALSTPQSPGSTPGAMFASDTTKTPVSDPSMGVAPLGASSPPQSGGFSPPQSGGSMPVPMAMPPLHGTVNKATADFLIKASQANRMRPVMTADDAIKAGSVPSGTIIEKPSASVNSDKKEQDRYFSEAVRGLQSTRGDQQIRDLETQRTAAISAYNRLSQIDLSGKSPNPVDYTDIVGQIYKARTGQAPNEVILKKALQETATGKWGEAMTFLTGEQRPATTQNIAASLKDMVAHMGFQADDLHDGAMRVHGAMVFNPNMNQENVAKLSKIARGKTFAEATGAKPEDFDEHLKAIKWAQANPDDPRSQPILQKAIQAKTASGGGSIGL